MLERASRSERPSARRTWLGRPEPLAQAEPAEKATSRTSEISRAASMPVAAEVEIAVIALLGRAVERPARAERSQRASPQRARHGRDRPRAARPAAAPPRRSRRTAPATACPSACRPPARRRGAAARARPRRGPTARRCPWARGSCARRRATMSQAPSGIGTRPKPWTASQKNSAPAAARDRGELGDRLDHADLVVDQHRRDEAGAVVDRGCGERRDRPGRRGRPAGSSTSKPCPLEPFDRVEHAGMLGRERDDPRRSAGSRAAAPFSAQLTASVAPEVKIEPARPAPPQRRRDLLARHLDRGRRLAAEPVRAVRIGEAGPRARAASPPPLRARAASSPDNRDRSCRAPRRFAAQRAPLRRARRRSRPRWSSRPKLTRITSRAAVLAPAHGGQHMAGLEAARRAGAAGRDGDAGEVELDQLRGAGHARHPIGSRWSAIRGASPATTSPPAATIAVVEPRAQPLRLARTSRDRPRAPRRSR